MYIVHLCNMTRVLVLSQKTLIWLISMTRHHQITPLAITVIILTAHINIFSIMHYQFHPGVRERTALALVKLEWYASLYDQYRWDSLLRVLSYMLPCVVNNTAGATGGQRRPFWRISDAGNAINSGNISLLIVLCSSIPHDS
jgi:hypothetical protein